jgi:hypothetical protein
MSRIVVDTDVASYIFNWHSLAQQYAEALRGSACMRTTTYVRFGRGFALIAERQAGH